MVTLQEAIKIIKKLKMSGEKESLFYYLNPKDNFNENYFKK